MKCVVFFLTVLAHILLFRSFYTHTRSLYFSISFSASSFPFFGSCLQCFRFSLSSCYLFTYSHPPSHPLVPSFHSILLTHILSLSFISQLSPPSRRVNGGCAILAARLLVHQPFPGLPHAHHHVLLALVVAAVCIRSIVRHVAFRWAVIVVVAVSFSASFSFHVSRIDARPARGKR